MLVFLDFLNLLQTLQYILTCFVILFILSPFNMKSMNTIQKYRHIIESYACILQIFVFSFLFLLEYVQLHAIKVCYLFSIHVYLYPMSSY